MIVRQGTAGDWPGTGRLRGWLVLPLALCLSLGGCGISRQILYSPDPVSATEPAWVGAAPQSVDVQTSDGLAIRGLYWPASKGSNDDIIIFFHGRNWTLNRSGRSAQYLAGDDMAVLVASYRGFSGNAGHPSEQGLLRDAAAFIGTARSLAGPKARVWLIGHSIGAAVAMHAAAQEGHIDGVIAMSSFVRVQESAPRIARAFIPDDWDNLTALESLSIPLIVIQGGLDRFIAPDSGDTLFSAYHGPSSLVMGVNARHNPDMEVLAPWLHQAISTMRSGSLDSLPHPPAGWVEKVRRP
ncbi:hypothetical protein SLG_29870 [Sphingobium sp. SYK-6]|uniref:alpha/beta hydrolase n=1 Tax=Sphingobium sp. (strain NBRC 103272 / SYK-6) TaxID=627192 RepID=UPI0002277374|nr:alpha/beta fold hydrolase [Sphingobium sp. SYK-6]BAK67662.1 hypothetical protein SLG_29870 [Sphingobium sp. SYK-6]